MGFMRLQVCFISHLSVESVKLLLNLTLGLSLVWERRVYFPESEKYMDREFT
jgi:hypothetical protein